MGKFEYRSFALTGFLSGAIVLGPTPKILRRTGRISGEHRLPLRPTRISVNYLLDICLHTVVHPRTLTNLSYRVTVYSIIENRIHLGTMLIWFHSDHSICKTPVVADWFMIPHDISIQPLALVDISNNVSSSKVTNDPYRSTKNRSSTSDVSKAPRWVDACSWNSGGPIFAEGRNIGSNEFVP